VNASFCSRGGKDALHIIRSCYAHLYLRTPFEENGEVATIHLDGNSGVIADTFDLRHIKIRYNYKIILKINNIKNK